MLVGSQTISRKNELRNRSSNNVFKSLESKYVNQKKKPCKVSLANRLHDTKIEHTFLIIHLFQERIST